MQVSSKIIGIGMAIAMLGACKNDPAPSSESQSTPTFQPVAVPKFDRDSAYAFVAKQVSFGPRVPSTAAHKACAKWLSGQFSSYGLQVIEQPFKAKAYTGKTLDCVNIMAQHKPEATKRILLAAHWDSRHVADSPLNVENSDKPILGADDGGSGVAVLLEIARQLQSMPPDIGVDLLLFDAEDHGNDSDVNPAPETWCLGSQHWSKNIVPSGYRPKYGILLDMVGAKGARFTKDGVSMNFAPDLMDRVWKLAQGQGYAHFVDEKTSALTDDHYFVNTIANIPMIDIIGKPANSQTGFGAHWHTHDDDMDVIDARMLRSVGQTMLEVIYREAAGKF